MCTQQSMRCQKTHGVLVTYLGMYTWDQGKMWEYENHVDDMQTRQTDELWWMTSQMSHTKQSHKLIAQLNHMG